MGLPSILMAAVLLAGPPTPTAERAPVARRVLDFELLATVARPTVTGIVAGPDLAVAWGRPDLHLRMGMAVLGGPNRQLSPAGHVVGEVVNVGTVHMCAAQSRRGFRVRLCGGGQLGGTNLRYYDFEQPGRRAMPWGALTGLGDLSIPLGRRYGVEDDRVGLLLQGGAMIPVLGPAIVMRAPDQPTFIRVPAAIGATFSVGLRVALR